MDYKTIIDEGYFIVSGTRTVFLRSMLVTFHFFLSPLLRLVSHFLSTARNRRLVLGIVAEGILSVARVFVHRFGIVFFFLTDRCRYFSGRSSSLAKFMGLSECHCCDSRPINYRFAACLLISR